MLSPIEEEEEYSVTYLHLALLTRNGTVVYKTTVGVEEEYKLPGKL